MGLRSGRESVVQYGVKLRRNVFDKAAGSAGLRSDYALAKAMKVNRSTVTRVRRGELRPGSAFIGGALKALAPWVFEELFEVVGVVGDETR
ncbi:transcriptional regulator [Actinosynnema sp. CS-041913]|uniref:transcriptional regulator n=1 Tax=Actinosynnema sp. CS-041913 TaxID=3239917 RepID=UPI003D911F16